MSWSTPKSATLYPCGKGGFSMDGTVAVLYHGAVPALGLYSIAYALTISPKIKFNFIFY